MSDTQNPASPNPVAEAAMARHLEAIRRLKVSHDFAYNCDDLVTAKITYLAKHCPLVLDIGRSSRSKFSLFDTDKIETMDINSGQSPPDIVDDICAPNRLQYDRYDGIVCLSVLEHVYDPFAAIAVIHKLLKTDGYLLLHLPFQFRYHAPADLAFTDGYRFSRDGIAWLLKDFSTVTLYSIRGPYSSVLNMQKFWKNRIEKNLGMSPSKWIDCIGLKLFGRPTSELQVSGYYAWAQK